MYIEVSKSIYSWNKKSVKLVFGTTYDWFIGRINEKKNILMFIVYHQHVSVVNWLCIDRSYNNSFYQRMSG